MEVEPVTEISPAETTIQSVVPTPNSGSKMKLDPTSAPPESLIYDGNGSTSSSLTRKQKNKAHVQFLALCWTLFLIGWNDGTTGPLLPRIQLVYDVRSCFRLADDTLSYVWI
jgi:hypothetical protein